MSLVKPAGIDGLNVTHPLYANITQFLEFGDSNTDLVSLAAFTTGATSADITALGKCVLATSANKGVSVDLSVNDADTILLIFQHAGSSPTTANDSKIVLTQNVADNQNMIDLSYEYFSSQDYEVLIRGDGGVVQVTTLKPFSDQGLTYGDPHAFAFSSSPADAVALLTACMDGTQVTVGSNTPQNDPYTNQPLSVELINSVAVDGDTHLSAAVVFNKRLTPTEMESITTDPWAMVGAVVEPIINTTDPLAPGSNFTLTATNFASAPVSPVTLTDSQGSTITVPVTISGSGPYTAVGTMPTLAEAVTAGTSLLFGDVTIELTT